MCMQGPDEMMTCAARASGGDPDCRRRRGAGRDDQVDRRMAPMVSALRAPPRLTGEASAAGGASFINS